MRVEMKLLFLEPQTFIKSLEQSYYRGKKKTTRETTWTSFITYKKNDSCSFQLNQINHNSQL